MMKKRRVVHEQFTFRVFTTGINAKALGIRLESSISQNVFRHEELQVGIGYSRPKMTTMDSTEPKHLCCTQEARPLQECQLR